MTTCVPDVPMQREAIFLTVNLSKRRSDVLVRHIDDLHAVIKMIKGMHPFAILTAVVLPEHCMHYGDCHRAIPTIHCAVRSSRSVSRGGWQKMDICASRQAKRERSIWQQRYWEHQIRDDGNQCIDNRYTDSHTLCIYCQYIERRIPCATPPSIYGHYPSNEI